MGAFWRRTLGTTELDQEYTSIISPLHSTLLTQDDGKQLSYKMLNENTVLPYFQATGSWNCIIIIIIIYIYIAQIPY